MAKKIHWGESELGFDKDPFTVDGDLEYINELIEKSDRYKAWSADADELGFSAMSQFFSNLSKLAKLDAVQLEIEYGKKDKNSNRAKEGID